MKKFFFLAACLWALGLTPALAQIGGIEVAPVRLSDVVMVRVSEEPRHSRLWINWPGREAEFIEFDWRDKEGQDINAGKGYAAVLTKLYQQGYHLQGIIPGVTGGGPAFIAYSTLVFTKGQ